MLMKTFTHRLLPGAETAPEWSFYAIQLVADRRSNDRALDRRRAG
jgi:hypothetical protein